MRPLPLVEKHPLGIDDFAISHPQVLVRDPVITEYAAILEFD
jgi:hypothetical protein